MGNRLHARIHVARHMVTSGRELEAHAALRSILPRRITLAPCAQGCASFGANGRPTACGHDTTEPTNLSASEARDWLLAKTGPHAAAYETNRAAIIALLSK